MKKRRILIIIILIIAIGAGSLGFYFHAGIDYHVQHVVTVDGNVISPSDFVILDEGSESALVSFADEELTFFAPGKHEVELTIRQGLRTERETVLLYVVKPVSYVTVEYSAPDQHFEPIDFIFNREILHGVNFYLDFVDYLPKLETLPVGKAPIEIKINDSIFTSYINVVDTVPPVAIVKDIEMLPLEALYAKDFIVEYFDASPIGYIGFYEEPNITTPGNHIVAIVIEDIHGNRALYEAMLTILPNDEPPTIEGVRNFEVMKNLPVRFREGVSAYDAFGRPLVIGVDTGQFNVSEPGLYDVTYYVEDAWGLRTEVTISIRVISVDPEYVRERADVVLASILREGMTQVEQARAIFNWISWNMTTATDIRRESIYEAALNGFLTRRGNCFTYYALSEVLLTRAGIPNMMIERIPGTPTTHRWNLINPDDMGWHHFDSMPTRVSINRFMFRSGQIPQFNALLQEAGSPANYFTYLPELYPEIVR